MMNLNSLWGRKEKRKTKIVAHNVSGNILLFTPIPSIKKGKMAPIERGRAE